MSTRITDLTLDEFRDFLRQTIYDLVEEVVDERLGLSHDPDEGLKMRPEFEASLLEYLASDRDGADADDVFRSLGLT